MSSYQPIARKVYDLYVHKQSAFNSIMIGAGLYYTVSNSKQAHIPLVFVMPNIYAGYHGMKYITEMERKKESQNMAANKIELTAR